MREALKYIYKNDGGVRWGHVLVYCTGVIGGKNRGDFNTLITDIYVHGTERAPCEPQYIDHVWLGAYDYVYHSDIPNSSDILRCKINKGRKISFTARILPYSDRSNYGLRLTNKSEVHFI